MFTELMASGSGSGVLNPTTKDKFTLSNNSSPRTVTIELNKSYIIWGALLQNDSTYRAYAQSIIKGNVQPILDSGGGESYCKISLSGTTLTVSHPGASVLTNPIRYGLYQLD